MKFCVVPAGRRSGKTELAKRKLVLSALSDFSGQGRYFFAAPKRSQAEGLAWEDLNALSPPRLVRKVSKSKLYIDYVTGARIQVVGLDYPRGIEGVPWDGGVVDEVADSTPTAWQETLMPALADRDGWCWFIGVPAGRNHYYDPMYLWGLDPERPEWAAYAWPSADILPAEKVEFYRRTMDPDLFAQELEASFSSYRGQVYKPFRRDRHCAPLLHLYDRDHPIIFCLDFNVAPGSAVVCQEALLPSGQWGTAVIGEVHVPYDSSTPAVCARLAEDWAGHMAPVLVYGDPAGGHRSTSGVAGTDWDLAAAALAPHFNAVYLRVDHADPGFRARVNAVRARLENAAGEVRLMVDPAEAPQTVLDLEGVRFLEGGAKFEIDKKRDPGRSHWADGLAYHLVREYPADLGPAAGAGRVVHG